MGSCFRVVFSRSDFFRVISANSISGFADMEVVCTSQAKVDTQTRKYTPKLFGRAFDIVLESDNSMRTQDVLRCRT